MIKHYLTIAWRSLLRQRIFSTLNIFGLSIGIVSALLIFLYVQDELRYDRFHSKADQIYRLVCTYYLPNDGGSETWAAIGPAVGPLVPKDFPEVAGSVRVRRKSNTAIQLPGSTQRFYERTWLADSNLFELFDFTLAYGNEQEALDAPFQVVLSKEAALKYFGKENALGEVLELPEDSIKLTVSGVLEDIPSYSHLQPEYLISYSTANAMGEYLNNWWNFNNQTYLLLKPGVDATALEEKLRYYSRQYIADQEDGSGYHQEYALQALTEIHLAPPMRNEPSEHGNRAYVYIFGIIGLMTLIIACVNFMNLATAQSVKRAKEVGLRRVVGAIRQQLIAQFLSEAFIMGLLALGLSIILAGLSINLINGFTGKALSMDPRENPIFVLICLSVLLFTSLLAGSYPSLFLSSFKPIETLRGKFSTSGKGSLLRKVLVIGQFTISIGLIIGTLTVYRQLNYMRQAELGFEKDQVLFIPTFGKNAAGFEVLKNDLEGQPSVLHTSLSSSVPGRDMGNNVVRMGWDDDAEWSDMRYIAADEHFAAVYGIELVAGRYFSATEDATGQPGFLLNESGVRRLGYESAEAALGQKLRWRRQSGTVIGVVRDFHFMSLKEAIEPFIMVSSPNEAEYLSIRFAAQDYQELLSTVSASFGSALPSESLEYHFLNEDFDQQYEAEERFGTIFTTFALLAILIACLGLFGLSAFTAEVRTKEVGIRKVLGAGVGQIVFLLTREFTVLVLIALVVATPLSWLALDQWLSGFQERSALPLWLFAVAGLIALSIAWLTVSFHSIKSARANPVKALKYE